MITKSIPSTILFSILVCTIGLSIGEPAKGAEVPFGITYTGGASVSTCCEQSVPTVVASREFSTAEKDSVEASFSSQYPLCANFTVRSSSALTNCHSLAFGCSRWINDPANYLGETAPCYEVDDEGDIFRFSDHSATAGPVPLTEPGPGQLYYHGKCFCGPVADHDECIYGSHTSRWKKRE